MAWSNAELIYKPCPGVCIGMVIGTDADLCPVQECLVHGLVPCRACLQALFRSLHWHGHTVLIKRQEGSIRTHVLTANASVQFMWSAHSSTIRMVQGQ